jgi:uncharacterized protein (DUF433 family)
VAADRIEMNLLEEYRRLTADDIRAAIKYPTNVVAHEEVITATSR